jgi:hypothetical protein
MAKKPLSYLFCFSCEHSPLLVFAPLFYVPPFLGLSSCEREGERKEEEEEEVEEIHVGEVA